jgi:hypothetical protein
MLGSNKTILEISIHVNEQFFRACQAGKLHGAQATSYLFIVCLTMLLIALTV